jgi:hypothetical protein
MHDSRHPILNVRSVYICDGGRLLCGEHAGAAARYTGIDISGAAVQEFTPDMMPLWIADLTYCGACKPADHPPACEYCGRTVSGWDGALALYLLSRAREQGNMGAIAHLERLTLGIDDTGGLVPVAMQLKAMAHTLGAGSAS